jgi:molybdopterin converting factor small subunit
MHRPIFDAMKVLLFGYIAEQAGTEVVEVEAASLEALRMALAAHIPEIGSLSYAIAVDRTIVHDDRPLLGHEEVAVLPPFAGG